MADVYHEDSSSSSYRQQHEQHRHPLHTLRKLHILLGVTGSVAAIKAPEIAVACVHQLGAQVRVVLTAGGINFWNKAQTYNPIAWKQMKELIDTNNQKPLQIGKNEEEPALQIHYADEEWKDWNQLGDPVLHIDLRDWADILIIAPLSAHTLAKLAHGLCDDTLSCVVRAWDWGHGTTTPPRPPKPLLLAPAMNTAMWVHPLTAQQLSTLQGFWNDNYRTFADDDNDETSSGTCWNGVRVIAPQVKELACGEVGDGALASVDSIMQELRAVMDRMSEDWNRRFNQEIKQS